MTRLELVRPKSVGFKPTASANSATRQYGRRCMIRTCNDGNVCTRYYRTPRCAGLCIPVPPSAYKIPNQSLEKYSGVLAPTSSMLFLARPMPYRTSHVPSIVELFTRSEAAYPSVTALLSIAASLCGTAMFDGAAQYVTVKERAFADCVSAYTTSKTRHCYYKAHCRIRALGSRTLRWNSSPQTVRAESNR